VTLFAAPKTSGNIVRRSFAVGQDISSTAGGAITLTALSGQAVITALGTEWTNFAQEFQQFRITRIATRFFPSTTSATSVTGPYQAGMYGCSFAGFVPTTASTLAQGKPLLKWSTLDECEVTIHGSRFPNSKLWNIYNVAIPADRDYGFAYTNAGTLAASSRIFSTLIELSAEFQGPQ